jgi:hypothetical protein
VIENSDDRRIAFGRLVIDSQGELSTMMKFTTKFLLAGAIAVVAIAMSVGESEAAKRRAAAKPATCGGPGFCSTNCANGFCSVFLCGVDGKWYPAVLTPICPQGNCMNVRKKC